LAWNCGKLYVCGGDIISDHIGFYAFGVESSCAEAKVGDVVFREDAFNSSISGFFAGDDK
jgi:hypothetical protein